MRVCRSRPASYVSRHDFSERVLLHSVLYVLRPVEPVPLHLHSGPNVSYLVFRMSLWLPRPAPPLIARIYKNHPQHILHPRIILAYRYSKHTPTHPIALRYQSTNAPHDNTRNASTSSSTPATPATETKPTPATPSPTKDVSTVKAPLMTRVWKKVKHEAAHYWAGSKLLVSEVRISARLQWKILHGESLTRRERRQVSGSLLFFNTYTQLCYV